MDLLQHLIVGGVVLCAAATLVRRVVGFVKPTEGESACKSCASGGPTCHPAPQESTPHAHPVVLYRPAER